MDHAHIPPAIASVVEPLREADEYARLQLQRQRGVYNILTGLPALFLLLPFNGLSFVFEFARDGVWQLGILTAGWTLFILSCYTHRLLLPLIRRRRPDWEATFLESSLVKKAIEKHFWFQAPLFMAYFFLVIAGTASLLLLMLRDHDVLLLDVIVWMQVVLHVIAMAIMAVHARKAVDKSVEVLYWVALPLGFLPLLFPIPQVPFVAAWVLFCFSLVMPPLIAGAVRLLAPRRWLVA